MKTYRLLLFPVSLALAMSLFGTGCGSSNRNPLSGNVVIDGQPAKEGYIEFLPLPGTNSPTTGCTIQDGRFEVPRKQGVAAGEFRVEIRAVRESGRMMRDALTDDESAQMEQFLPSRYNTKSELTVTVGDGEEHNFDLTTSEQGAVAN